MLTPCTPTRPSTGCLKMAVVTVRSAWAMVRMLPTLTDRTQPSKLIVFKLQCHFVVANIGSWKYIDRHRHLKAFSNQGLTTVVGKDGSTSLLYRGDYSIPRAVKSQGWVHVGDPGSSQGYVIDPY